MHNRLSIVIALSLFSSLGASAQDSFSVEEPLPNPSPIPIPVIADLSHEIDLKRYGCSETSLDEALEATHVSINGRHHEILVKPKTMCLCGATYCPVWIYRHFNSTAKRIWHSPGTAIIEILDNKTNGYRQIRDSGGTSGHSHETLWAWDGKKYRPIKNSNRLLNETEK